jgi:hypothetical protein
VVRSLECWCSRGEEGSETWNLVSLSSGAKSANLICELMWMVFGWHRSKADASAVALLGIIAETVHRKVQKASVRSREKWCEVSNSNTFHATRLQ